MKLNSLKLIIESYKLFYSVNFEINLIDKERMIIQKNEITCNIE
jgi:hypothetical protein